MGAAKSPGQTSSAVAVNADTIQQGIAKSLLAPKKMMEANLRAGSALLSFASHRMQAQVEFVGRFLHCDSVEQAATAQRDFLTAMVGDYTREMNELMDIARENSTFLAGPASEPAAGVKPA